MRFWYKFRKGQAIKDRMPGMYRIYILKHLAVFQSSYKRARREQQILPDVLRM